MSYALTVDGLTVDFNGFKAVDNFTTTIDTGELRVILGPNGAGKTTLMDLISGKTTSTSGEVKLFGREITRLNEHQIARAGIGRKFQIPSIFRDLSVMQNLEVSASGEPSVFKNLKYSITQEEKQKIEEVIELTDLSDVLKSSAGDLSHGQMQWLELGMLITQDAKVILLDEPTAGMTKRNHENSRYYKKIKRKTYYACRRTRYGFCKRYCGTITVMHLGKLLAEGDIDTIEKDEAVREAYLGSGGIH